MKIKGKLIKEKDIEYGIFDCTAEDLFPNLEYNLLKSKLTQGLDFNFQQEDLEK